jgi:glucose-1-phosphate thymidylyltransferase
MKDETLKIVIPMAGYGSRLRPHTWSKPKQLLSIAGKTVLDHLIESLSSLPNFEQAEFINIVGYLGNQIEVYFRETYPHLTAHFVVQEEPQGQSHAILLARKYLQGPMLMVFGDTLIETDLSSIPDTSLDGLACVKSVPDPRRFGVAELDEERWVKRLIEKPLDVKNNLAVVGFYYFKDSDQLLRGIDEQMERDLQLNGEYFLADAVNILLERGMRMRVQEVDTWLDAGTPEAMLDTNRYFLEHGQEYSPEDNKRLGNLIVPPVYIHPSALLEKSIIGPYVSLGADCQIRNSIISNSILEDGVQIENMLIERSLVGRRSNLRRDPTIFNVGDDTTIKL